MFGSDMMKKLQDMQAAAEESKKRLESISVTGKAGGGLIQIELTGNRNFKSVKINTDHKLMDVEELEDYIALAFEDALRQANEVNEKEVMSSASSFLPGMGF